MYRIKKVLNNNVVISEDNKKQEIIVTGNGIGFGVKPRSIIPQDKIKRIYIPDSREFTHRFMSLVNEIPYECFEMAEKVKEMAEGMLKENLNQNLIIALADHISFALSQIQEGKMRVALMNEEIERYYPDEFAIGKKAVRMVEETFHVKWNETEAFAFAFHIINAETGARSDDAVKIMQSISDIVKIIEDTTQVTLHKGSLDYTRMVIHLKFFLKRILIKKVYDDHYAQLLLNPNGEEFKGIAKCLDEIDQYIQKKFDHVINDTERVYLLIHIARVLDI